jgi:lipopolysaccharide export system permease protein
MPLLWRYLLKHYLKVFFLCVVSFIAILLTLRLSEIAYFATLGPRPIYILWFALQQIPFVLPIAFPVSALIASILLMQTLSRSKELTAMRSAGLALRDIMAPLLFAALFLSCLNFVIISELSTSSQRNAGQLKNELRAVNPLLLLNNTMMMRMRGFYFDTLGNSKVGEFAEKIILVAPSGNSDRLSLMTADRIDVSPAYFTAAGMALVTSSGAIESAVSEGAQGGGLMIENMQEGQSTTEDFTRLIEKKIWSVSNDHFSFRHLLVRRQEVKTQLAALVAQNGPAIEIKQARNDFNRTTTEIIRRFSVAISVFSFTLLGLAFGITIGRHRSHLSLLIVALLSSSYLVAFFTAKSFDQAVIAATLLYTIPHALIWIASLWNLSKVSRGIE